MKASRHVDAPVLQTLEPYPEMKDSGVPALGNQPVHWQVLRVKNLCRMRSGDGITAESITPVGAYPVYGGNGQRGYTSEYTHDGTFVLIGRQGALCGNVHLARGRFWASEHAVVTTVRSGYLPAWLGAILTVMDLNQYSIAAAQPGLSVERVLALRLPVPPVSEQAAIVRFLDHADRRIRRYIRAQQKLIALLEEQKQAIINQAVTGQIDVRAGRPYPAYKPSGIEWLGDVPTHWEIGRLKVKLRPIDCRSSSGTETLLSLRRDLGVVVYAEHFSRPPQGVNLVGYKLVETGQLVVNRLQANNGLLFCSRLSGVVSPDYSVFTARSPVDMEYLGSLLRTITYKAHFRRESTGLGTGSAGFLRLYDDRLLETPVALPPLEDQRTLLVSLNEVTASLCRAIDRQHVGVTILREYRTRLIADVVTGKLDVREAAAGLPDEVKELEPFDETSSLIDGEEEPTDALAT